MKPLARFPEAHLVFRAPEEAFLLHVKSAMLAGFLFSMPYWVLQFWLFILPGLYRHEKRAFFFLMTVSALLFLLGAWFGYAWVVPAGLSFLLGFQTEHLKPLLEAGPYFSFIAGTAIAFGSVFNFPVMVTGLVYFRILSSAHLKAARKWSIVGIFIVAAILTPSPDPVSQILLAVPLLVLFEISYGISRLIEKMRPRGVEPLTF